MSEGFSPVPLASPKATASAGRVASLASLWILEHGAINTQEMHIYANVHMHTYTYLCREMVHTRCNHTDSALSPHSCSHRWICTDTLRSCQKYTQTYTEMSAVSQRNTSLFYKRHGHTDYQTLVTPTHTNLDM